jgi:hypothetical protein
VTQEEVGGREKSPSGKLSDFIEGIEPPDCESDFTPSQKISLLGEKGCGSPKNLKAGAAQQCIAIP